MTPIICLSTISETEFMRSKQGTFRLFSRISSAHAFVVLQATKSASKFISIKKVQISFAINLISLEFLFPKGILFVSAK